MQLAKAKVLFEELLQMLIRNPHTQQLHKTASFAMSGY